MTVPEAAPAATRAAEVRTASEADFEAVAGLLVDRGEPADAVDLRRMVDDPQVGWSHVGVVEVDGTVVATASWIATTIEVGATVLPAGQVELVATHRGHEGKGYVRRLMAWCHQESMAAGHLVQFMVGIPHFYRKFGYEYSIPMHSYAKVTDTFAAPNAITVRRATDLDLDAMLALQRRAQASFDVRIPHSRSQLGWLLDRDGSAQYIAVRAGRPVGTARWTDVEGDVAFCAEIVADDPEVTTSLLAAARRDDATLWAMARPGVPGLLDCLGALEPPEWYYVRVSEPNRLLDALRPEFDARLAVSEFAELDGSFLLSWWSGHVRSPIERGRIGPFERGGALQAPVASGGSGVPFDALGRLLFSDGAIAVEDRFPDCYLGDQRALMSVMFPACTTDALTWYLP